jgi:hypothetical protein
MHRLPDEAQLAFYAAFERRDLDAMRSVWSADDSIVCIHPMGPCLRGNVEVMDSWRAIFEQPHPMRFRILPIERITGPELSVHWVFENIEHGPGLRERSVVIASNVYRLRAGSWLMCAHHASPGRLPVTSSPDRGIVH